MKTFCSPLKIFKNVSPLSINIGLKYFMMTAPTKILRPTSYNLMYIRYNHQECDV